MKKLLSVCLWVICFGVSTMAQRLTVESFIVKSNDLSASTTPRLDNNGVPCALVKVQLVAEGAQFEGWVMGNVEYRTSEYWVYMAEGSKRLTVRLKGYLPMSIEFKDYEVNVLKSKQTYILVINSEVSKGPKQGVTVKVISGGQIINVNGIVFNMIQVPGGTFTMGATKEQGHDATESEGPLHTVSLSSYYIGQTEVTQGLWKAVMGSNPSMVKRDDLPVGNVSWNDCQMFICKLNSLTGMNFRLPTEAEWEYAARGGKKSRGYKYSGSNTISEVAWCWDNASSGLHPVATKRPNELGLFDMSGNVWEWCQDGYENYSGQAQVNPQGPCGTSNCVLRGGSWFFDAKYCRVSYRYYNSPGCKRFNYGFRLALP